MINIKMLTFVKDYYKPMIDKISHYLHEYYEQDYLIMAGKTLVGMVVLNIPQWLVDNESAWKGFTAVIGAISAILALLLLCFKVYDQVTTRWRDYRSKKATQKDG